MNQNEQDTRYLKMAHLWAGNSHAVRLKVGALLVKNGTIIADGYNGTLHGFPNVCEYAKYPDGTTKEFRHVWQVERLKELVEKGEVALVTKQDVLHAEANAISKVAKSTQSCEGATLYVTDSPCYACSLMLAQMGIKRLVYDREYRDTSGIDLLVRAGVQVVRVPISGGDIELSINK